MPPCVTRSAGIWLLALTITGPLCKDGPVPPAYKPQVPVSLVEKPPEDEAPLAVWLYVNTLAFVTVTVYMPQKV